ncbi:hypothetical protein EII17_10835 [Clostridiales bacterium COT073_COT-073]|nr:hypothetical protein EII17_10835 [Clostridiales bacterium COT073_COT-073]
MNRFDELCIFRVAELSDTDRIMSFIKKYWKDTHILANNRPFFLYEFAHKDHLNVFLTEDRKTGEIQAMMGFFSYSFDEKSEQTDYSGSILKVRDDCSIPLLGIETIKRFFENKRPRQYIGNGSNPITALPWQKRALRHYTGKLKHYYRLNENAEYQIAQISEKRILRIEFQQEYYLQHYKDAEELYAVFDESAFKNRLPYKDKWYIKKRYFDHPIYRYFVCGINDGGKVDAVLIGREVSHNGSKIFRIVDLLGDCSKFRGTGKAWEQLMQQEGYEYVDIYQYGMDAEVLRQAGFIDKEETLNNIVPNYFEPFVQENIDIYFHTPCSNSYIFKADGDQDRPNFGNV